MNDQKDKLWPMLQKLGVQMKFGEKEFYEYLQSKLVESFLVRSLMVRRSRLWVPTSFLVRRKTCTSRVSRELFSAYMKVITSIWNLWFLVNRTEPIGSELES